MLARTFLTAKELHCSEIERQAAIEVLGQLERGELQFFAITRYWKTGDWKRVHASIPADAFNMAFWSDCMGGWMERAKGRSRPTHPFMCGLSQQCQKRWADLFEPEGFDSFPEFFTPERCARALHAKLTTGQADWSARNEIEKNLRRVLSLNGNK